MKQLDDVKFGADLDLFLKTLKIDYRKGIRKVALDLFNGVVKRTPVDQGRARGSWVISTYRPKHDVLPPRDKGVYPKPTFNLPPSDLKLFPPIYLSNNLDYILALEEGHSKEKAPEGMLRITIQELQSEIESILRAA